MDYCKLGNTELTVSAIGLGCVTFGREIDRDAAFAVADRALERGITLFDTAEAYAAGASETVLGEWIADRGIRDRIVLATKVAGKLTRQRIVSSAEESLQRLRTEQIDLFQLHSWDDETPLEETLSALTELIEQGKVRFVGCSNWTASQLRGALTLAEQSGFARLDSVQPPYNLVQREIEADLLALCADRQVGVISYSPLAAGFLTGKYRRDGEVPAGTRFDVIPGHQPIYFTDHGFDVLERLTTVAEETGHSPIQLALAWVLNRPHVTTVLIGARSPAHVDQAFAARDAGYGKEILEKLGT